jgi:hypothetical protein
MKRTLDQDMESRGALHSEILSDQAAKAEFGKRQKVIVLVAAGVFFTYGPSKRTNTLFRESHLSRIRRF